MASVPPASPPPPGSGRPDSPGGGEGAGGRKLVRTRPRIWPLGVLLLVQVTFLGVLFLLAARYAPPARLLPVDALVPSGEVATIGVRLVGSRPVGPLVAGVRVTFLSRGGDAGRDAGADAGRDATRGAAKRDAAGGGAGGLSLPLAATTDSHGLALVGVPAPAALGFHALEAKVDSPSSLKTVPSSVEVIAAGAPLDSACVLVLVPGALLDALRTAPPADRNAGGAAARAADALSDIARHAVVGYIVDPSWSDAPGLRERLAGRGLPRGPILRGSEGERWLLRSLRDLAPSRWRGPFWVVVVRSIEAEECTAMGARAIVLGSQAGPTGDPRISSAASWSDVKARILRP